MARMSRGDGGSNDHGARGRQDVRGQGQGQGQGGAVRIVGQSLEAEEKPPGDHDRCDEHQERASPQKLEPFEQHGSQVKELPHSGMSYDGSPGLVPPGRESNQQWGKIRRHPEEPAGGASEAAA